MLVAGPEEAVCNVIELGAAKIERSRPPSGLHVPDLSVGSSIMGESNQNYLRDIREPNYCQSSRTVGRHPIREVRSAWVGRNSNTCVRTEH